MVHHTLDISIGVGYKSSIVGVFNDEGPPVPIPNTEVKLRRAEDTLPATARENRSAPTSDPIRKDRI